VPPSHFFSLFSFWVTRQAIVFTFHPQHNPNSSAEVLTLHIFRRSGSRSHPPTASGAVTRLCRPQKTLSGDPALRMIKIFPLPSRIFLSAIHHLAVTYCFLGRTSRQTQTNLPRHTFPPMSAWVYFSRQGSLLAPSKRFSRVLFPDDPPSSSKGALVLSALLTSNLNPPP